MGQIPIENQNQSTHRTPVAGHNAQHTVHILIVDDLIAITQTLSRQLKNHYTVFTADSAVKALEILQVHKVDIIISDVMMPHISGPEFYEQVVSRWPTLKKYFIFMTGGILEEKYKKFFEKHDIVCLNKPYSKSTLIRHIEKMLD